jgi:hypothetical protein
MDKGEGIMPVPQGVISTSEGPVDPEVVQEVVQVLEEVVLPEDDFDPEQV